MKHLRVLSEHTYAGHCSTGGSNKDWAACLALETDEQESRPPAVSETTEVVYLSVHGPHGGHMVVDSPKTLRMKQARTHFSRKCHEKDDKGYAHVPFAPYLPAFGRPLGLALMATLEQGQQADGGVALSSNVSAGETAQALGYQAVAVQAASLEKIQQLLALGNHAISEKVNGERCIVVFEEGLLRAYNRRGKLMSAPPEGAKHLCRLGCPFVVDGERLVGEQAGSFVAFDLLEWDKASLVAFSYLKRIMTLEGAMLQAGLLHDHRSTPTFIEARANSTEADLALLIAAAGTDLAEQVIKQVQASSGEGIVVRRLDSPYKEPPLKFKFTADLDAFVIGINEGVAEGSLKLGVRREEDQAIIEVANVRSGLTDADIRAVRARLGQGERPVFTVSYLPVRTVGIQLVEPRTGMALLRSDKEADECSSGQFGPEKASFIAQAKPVS